MHHCAPIVCVIRWFRFGLLSRIQSLNFRWKFSTNRSALTNIRCRCECSDVYCWMQFVSYVQLHNNVLHTPNARTKHSLWPWNKLQKISTWLVAVWPYYRLTTIITIQRTHDDAFRHTKIHIFSFYSVLPSFHFWPNHDEMRLSFMAFYCFITWRHNHKMIRAVFRWKRFWTQHTDVQPWGNFCVFCWNVKPILCILSFFSSSLFSTFSRSLRGIWNKRTMPTYGKKNQNSHLVTERIAELKVQPNQNERRTNQPTTN